MFERDPQANVEEAVNIEISRPKRDDGAKDLVINVTIKRKIVIPDDQPDAKQPTKKATKKTG